MPEVISPDGDQSTCSREAARSLTGKGWTVIGDGPAPRPTGSSAGEDPDEPKVQDPAAPRGNASRDTWAAYAEQIGLQVADEDSREDIKSAVAELEK